MAIFKLSDLSEEERKKYYEKLNNEENEMRQRITDETNRINKMFDEQLNTRVTNKSDRLSIARTAYNNTNNKMLESKVKINDSVTNNKPIQNVMLNDLRKTKSSNVQNIGLKEYSKNNGSDLSKGAQNLWLGLQNGIIDLNNTIGRRITEGLNSHVPKNDAFNEYLKKSIEKHGIKDASFDTYNKYSKDIEYQPKNTELKEKNLKKIQENADTSSNIITKYINENITPAIGQMLPSFIPGAGPLYMAGSATGSYYDEGKKRGMSDEEANKYSAKMGMAETLSEMIPVGKIIKTTKSAAKQGAKKTLKDIATVGIENAVQEGIMEPTSELMAGEKYANWDNMGGRIASSALAGGLVGGVLAGTGAGIGSTQKLLNNREIRDTRIENKAQKLQEQQITQDNNKVPPNENMEQIQENKNEIEKIQNSLYNNSNESESDINGGNQKEPWRNINSSTEEKHRTNDGPGVERLSTPDIGRKTDSGRYQTNNDDKKEISFIRNKDNHMKNLNENQTRIKNRYAKVGIPVEFYSLDSKNGGRYDNGTLYVNTYNTTDLEQANIAMHEYAHHLLRNNEKFQDEIRPIADKIIENEETGKSEAIRNFIMDRTENITTDDLDRVYKMSIEEILADYVMDIDNQTNFNENNQYDVDIDLLNNYKDIVKQYLPNKDETSDFNKYKKNIIEQNEKSINKLISEKNDTIRSIDEKIGKKQAIYNSLKNKDTISANKVLQQIERLKTRKTKIENDYNHSIDKFNSNIDNEKIEKIALAKSRKSATERFTELANDKIKNISNWKDKKNGFAYKSETMERNMYDIIPDNKEAKDIIDTYFTPIHENEAEKQRFINKYNERINAINLNNAEAEAVQLLGEKKYNPEFKDADAIDVIERVNQNIKDGKIDRKKVDNAIEEFRNIYDELIEEVNKILLKNGYKPIPYRKGYFPHFQDYKAETKVGELLNKIGINPDMRDLPTDIAGITDQFVPGKTWNRNAQERKGNKTDYNVLKGFDMYIQSAADNIFHTEDIQKLRGLENAIRYEYSSKAIQQEIDDIKANKEWDSEKKQEEMQKVFERVDNPMPNLVSHLREYTNLLANKKSQLDREAESFIGRKFYSVMDVFEKRFGANAVGGNLGSAITNIIPITQAWSQVSTKNTFKAMANTINSYIKDDGFINKSTFLTNRLKQSNKLYKDVLTKVSDIASLPFNAIDNVVSQNIVRAKYLDNIEKGMSEQEAIKNADTFAAEVMGDRSKGATPTLFQQRNPLVKTFTQFQLEVNNQYRYMFKDLPRELKEEGVLKLAGAFFKMFVGAWLYNLISEKITGRKSAFSPLDIGMDTAKTIQDNNKKTYEKIADISKDLASDLPFVGGLLGGGRIPISGALPDPANTIKATTGLITGEMDSKKAVSMLGKEVAKPLAYTLPPVGGGQIKKSIEGLTTVAKGGSYSYDKDGNQILQFPVEEKSVGNYASALVFGKYSLPEARDYSKRNYKSLSAKQTNIYNESKLPYKELLNYIDQKFENNNDKINYINSKDMNIQQKWGIYKYDIFSKKEREDGTSEQSDAEYITSHGVSKEKYLKEYNYAKKNDIKFPTTSEYIKMKSTGISFDSYMNYQKRIYNEKQTQIKNGTLKDGQALKEKDKVKIVLDSNYSDKEKAALYENYLNGNDDKTYNIMKKAKININDYLDYKLQEFQSDKEDDGTLNGKTISGSKKAKFYDYIANSNLNYGQRLLLTGINYKLQTDERNTLANYIDSLNLSYNDKKSIYEKLVGATIYKNGEIYY